MAWVAKKSNHDLRRIMENTFLGRSFMEEGALRKLDAKSFSNTN